MIETRIVYNSEYDNVPMEGVLVDKFNCNGKEIALIFYREWVARDTEPYFEDDDGDLVCEPIHVRRPLFRYVETDNERLEIHEGEKAEFYGKDKNDLILKYCQFYPIKEFYFEDYIYMMVNKSN